MTSRLRAFSLRTLALTGAVAMVLFATADAWAGSGSGGYRRPSTATSSSSALRRGSAVDRSVARQSSKQALDRFRSQGSGSGSSGWGTAPDAGTSDRRPSTAGGGTASYPTAPRRPSTSGGFGEAVLGGVIGGALENLARGDRHAGRSGWRSDAAVLPPPRPASGGSGSSWFGWLTGLLLLGGLVFLGVVVWRKLSAGQGRGAKSSAGDPRRAVTGGSAARPRWLSLQRPLTLDAAPFILASPYVALEVPSSPTGSGMVGLEAVGEAVSGDLTWHRGYLAGRRSFLQIHLDTGGRLDECRYFSLLDELTPGDVSEWGFWLDEREGMIGWPQFETKDGKSYSRLWVDGQQRVPPRDIAETLETVSGVERCRQQAMLYSRDTGAAAPAPTTEYLLVATMERDDAAAVTLHVGIDLDPASLQLP